MINKECGRRELFPWESSIIDQIKRRRKMSGAKNLTFVILAAFPFLLMAVFEKIDHALKGGLGGF